MTEGLFYDEDEGTQRGTQRGATDAADNAAAFAAVEAIRSGRWDRHLKALLMAVNERRTRAHAR